MNKTADSNTIFKFMKAYLMVRRVQPKPLILSAHDQALTEWALARYNITRVDLKTFTFSATSKSWSIYNAVLGPSPNGCCSPRLRTLISKAQLTQPPTNLSVTISANFRFKWTGKHVHNVGLILDMHHEKTYVMAIGHSLKDPAYITRTRDYR